MMSIKTAAELGVQGNTELSPSADMDLRIAIGQYQSAVELIERGERQKTLAKELAKAAMERDGVLRAEIEGVTVQWVFPSRTTLDKKKLLAQGVTYAEIERATVTEDTTPYISIKGAKK